VCLYRGDYARRRHYPLCLLYLGWMLITLFSRGDFNLTESGNRAALVNQCALCCVALPFAQVVRDRKRRYLSGVLTAVISVCAVMIWLCWIGTVTGRDVTILGDLMEFGARYTTTGRLKLKVMNLHYYHLGYISVACFFVSLYLAASHWTRRFIPFWILMLGTFMATVLMTYSRTGVFAMLGGLLIALYLPLEKACRKKGTRIAVFAVMLCAGVVLTCLGLNVIYKAVHSIRDIWYGMASLSSRTDIWSGTLRALFDNPSALLFGFPLDTGMDTVNAYIALGDSVSHTHSGLLHVWISLGTVGMLLALAFYVYLIRCCLRLYFAKEKPAAVRLLVPLPAALIFINLFESALIFGEPKVTLLSVIFMLVAGYIIEESRDGLEKN
jgi:O-antigen ligase